MQKQRSVKNPKTCKRKAYTPKKKVFFINEMNE